jgi:catalase
MAKRTDTGQPKPPTSPDGVLSAATSPSVDGEVGGANQSPGRVGMDPDGGQDPALDLMARTGSGYPDVLVKPAAEHPVRDREYMPHHAMQGDRLTTGFGVRVNHTDDSLKVGPRGPVLLEDHHLREKVSHFDHERIPERVVHARGNGAHGHFQPYESLADLTCAAFLSDPSIVTPVFVRFSTVLGSRGAAETTREVRGFATKFYTSQGNFDLVGNNIPVFFIKDGIKFPDLIHAAKPEPHREIPQSASAHDTFWDFVSLVPESTHMLMWAMSDRTIPRSYRTMEGFGVHTFRLVNSEGDTTLVKFHWKPVLGVHSLLWEEAQLVAGVDPDFLRRDLYDAIDDGAFPQWELGIQTFPDTDDQMFEGIDLLDSTKFVPEELAPVRSIGLLTLDRNPTDFFAESEQVAYCTSHLVPGIDGTDDPLLHARHFSYFDTQITRLGGPNFESLPINRPLAPVNSMQQDGFGQTAILSGRARYSPNSLGGGCPVMSTIAEGGFVHVPLQSAGAKTRQRPVPQPDWFSQATLFWRSMSEVEQDHVASAFAFELSKVEVAHVRARMLRNLAEVDEELTERVAAALGMAAPAPEHGGPDASVTPSPALTQLVDAPGRIDGRVIALLVDDGVDGEALAAVAAALRGAQARPQTVAPHLGFVLDDADKPVPVSRSFLTTKSVEFDALVLCGGTANAATLADEPAVATMLQEAFRHHKTIGAWGEAVALLDAVDIDPYAPGVVTIDTVGSTGSLTAELIAAIGMHRHWDR